MAHASRSRRSSRRNKRPLLSCLSVLLASCLLTSPASAASPDESLSEQLLLKPLPDGRVLASFDFTLISSSASNSSFRLLPRALLQPIQHFGVSEVHLSLNSGRWRYNSWGSPVTLLRNRDSYEDEGKGRTKLGEESVGTGAELWAKFAGVDEEGVIEAWKGLTSALAGLFCTSLDALDERHTVMPKYAYGADDRDWGTQTIHALLPTEGVCTENLTPFLKLLPCKASAGLASLLNPLSLFGANFQGLAVHVRNTAEGGWEVKLTFTSVFAPAVTRDVSIRNWSLSSLFGRTLHKSCPLADRSLVRILKPNDPDGTSKYQVKPLPSWPASAVPGEKKGKELKRMFPVMGEEDEVTDELASVGLLAWETEAEEEEYQERLSKRWSHYLDSEDGEYLYDVFALLNPTSSEQKSLVPNEDGNKGLDISMTWPHETRLSYPPSTDQAGQVISVERSLLGHGQERTTLQVVLTNNDPRLAQRVLWYETLGYFVKPYLHTLKHDIQFLPSSPANSTDDELLRSIDDFNNPVEELLYQPTVGDKRGDRRPFVLESVVRVPARSKVVLTMELRKVFVPYSQHPPDAHRGFDLAPAVIFPLAPVDPRESLLHRSASSSSRRSSITAPTSAPNKLLGLLKGYLKANTQEEPQGHRSLNRVRASKTQTRIYTLPRLVELATPDFSFVYTNIIFTSTVVALFFGSSLNTLLRTFSDFVI